jgi:hypothetical protein
MSVFTNSSSHASENAQAYMAAVLDLLGARDPVEVLRTMPTALRQALQGLSGPQLVEPEAEGKWSMRHVVQHLADAELASGWRLRLVLAQDRPTLTGYDQDLWAGRLRYEHANAEHALEEFALMRRGNLRLIEQVTQDDLKRVGVHAERGEQNVALMVRMWAGHDLLHLRQIDRIRQAVVRQANSLPPGL